MTTSESVWIRSFLAALGVFHKQPMELFCGSQAALHISNNPMLHECTKHIEIDYYFVREKLEAKLLEFSHIRRWHQPTDIFTKALRKKQFHYLKGKLDMLDLHAPTWGLVLPKWYLSHILTKILWCLILCLFYSCLVSQARESQELACVWCCKVR